MKIKIKCRINSMKINGKDKSVGVTVCDELNFCNLDMPVGLKIDEKQLCFLNSKKLTKEINDDFFNFISAHSRETFIITIEGKEEDDSAIIKLDDVDCKVVEVELIYG